MVHPPQPLVLLRRDVDHLVVLSHGSMHHVAPCTTTLLLLLLQLQFSELGQERTVNNDGFMTDCTAFLLRRIFIAPHFIAAFLPFAAAFLPLLLLTADLMVMILACC